MLNPPRPSDESFRLEALHRLGLMDTPSEPRFDRIVQLAVRRFGVRTALISLVDAERLWLKAKVGVDFCELPRQQSLCAHALMVPGVFVVEDTRSDARFAEHPAVAGLEICPPLPLP